MIKRIKFAFFLLLLISLSFGLPISSVLAYYTNMDASVVVGQQGFTTRTSDLGGIGPAGIQLPLGNVTITSDNKLIIAECSNSRVTIFNNIPTQNFASANVVVGQNDFAGELANQGGSAGANT